MQQYTLLQVLILEGQFVKNLRQEACGPDKSRHYTSMLLNFQELNYGFLVFSKTIDMLNILWSWWTTIQQQLILIIWGELGPICVKVLLSTYGSEQQNEKYGFQQPTSQDLKMLQQKKTPECLNDPQNGNLRRADCQHIW